MITNDTYIIMCRIVPIRFTCLVFLSDDGTMNYLIYYVSSLDKCIDCVVPVCLRNPEPVHGASHIIQNVASGVSKAAATAYYTAKDVFYTLQAKQVRKWLVNCDIYSVFKYDQKKFWDLFEILVEQHNFVLSFTLPVLL